MVMKVADMMTATILGFPYHVAPFYLATGALLAMPGLALAYKAYGKVGNKQRPAGGMAVKAIAAALLALALLPVEVIGLASLGVVMVASGQGTSFNATASCYTAYVYTTVVQNVVLGLVVVTAIIVFIPFTLGRTRLGRLFADYYKPASGLLILLIFIALFVYPINVMFTSGSSSSGSGWGVGGGSGGWVTINYTTGGPPTPSSCTISLQNLEQNGPPMLSALLKVWFAIVKGLQNPVPPPPSG